MLIPTDEIRDWRDLQEKVAMFFREMGYDSASPSRVQLAGRGQKEIDVLIIDPRASVNQIMLAECKFWETPVSQETVHSFHTVMIGAGANTGFIISKVGFQKGAFEATNNTNIHLLTWEELQHKFGRQWYIHRVEAVEKMIEKLREIDRAYLDQFNPAVIHNSMFFAATGLQAELYDVLADIRIALQAAMFGPKTYDVAPPIQVSVYEGFPHATRDRWGLPILILKGVREFFEWVEKYGQEQLNRFDNLKNLAHQRFDILPDGGHAAMHDSLKQAIEESPIRTFKNALGEDLYNRLILDRLVRRP